VLCNPPPPVCGWPTTLTPWSKVAQQLAGPPPKPLTWITAKRTLSRVFVHLRAFFIISRTFWTSVTVHRGAKPTALVLDALINAAVCQRPQVGTLERSAHSAVLQDQKGRACLPLIPIPSHQIRLQELAQQLVSGAAVPRIDAHARQLCIVY
jgi:hypothetical protein